MFFIHLGRTFPHRVAEWYLGAVLFSWGIVLLMPEETFDRAASYEVLGRIAPEHWWGYGCMMTGGLRLIALGINGYWVPPTYHLRSLFSFMSLIFWIYISFGMLTAGYFSTGLASYPMKVFLEMFCLYRTVRDYRQSLAAQGLPSGLTKNAKYT